MARYLGGVQGNEGGDGRTVRAIVTPPTPMLSLSFLHKVSVFRVLVLANGDLDSLFPPPSSQCVMN